MSFKRRPRASSAPTCLFRLRVPVQVSTRSPRPLSPASVSRRPPAAHASLRDLREPTGDERGQRVVPEPQPFDDARRDRDDVLHRPADLDADDIVAAVQAEERAAELVLHELRSPARRRDAARTAVGSCCATSMAKLGPDSTTTGCAGPASSAITSRHAQQRVGLEPLGGADDDGVPAEMMRASAKHRAAAVRRHGANRPARRRAARRSSSCVDGDGGGQRHVGQVDDVGAARRHVVDERLIARPQPDFVADPRQVHGQRRPPASRAEYRDGRHQARAPSRRSVPARSRARLTDAGRQSARDAAHAAASIAAGAAGAYAIGGSAIVASTDPSDT